MELPWICPIWPISITIYVITSLKPDAKLSMANTSTCHDLGDQDRRWGGKTAIFLHNAGDLFDLYIKGGYQSIATLVERPFRPVQSLCYSGLKGTTR